jgi:MarR family transcriptional regulator for hemolysin
MYSGSMSPLPAPPLADLSRHFTEQFILISRAWRREADLRLLPLGLSHATAAPLTQLLQVPPEGCRQGELAVALGIEQPSLVRLLDQLCAAGFAERHEDLQDRRAKLLRLTASGQVVARQATTILKALREELLGGAAPGDLEAASRVLRAMRANLGRPLPDAGGQG